MRKLCLAWAVLGCLGSLACCATKDHSHPQPGSAEVNVVNKDPISVSVVAEQPIRVALAPNTQVMVTGCSASCSHQTTQLECRADGAHAACTKPDATTAVCTDGTTTTTCRSRFQRRSQPRSK